ncbi:sugar phosphate isomerase/epimerase family protein [Desertihabitans aurantiacus]|uniref:sugar phosphate isomerase/epimerase family protein n=1 Tax=Desertihabitans aurantiacus TaxID=2282477 RepID=UPI000DF84D79|nr:sugar phosphate isomerase/epimerase family protein [Desertihabitans aurantiacus]
MRFSVFTASTPEWTPEEAARTLAEQGYDGIEWRVVDDPGSPDGKPGFWRGNQATWPLTGLEESVEEIARVSEEAGLEISGLCPYVPATRREDVERVIAATAAVGAKQLRVSVPGVGADETYPEVFDRVREAYAWVAERAAAHGVKALVELHHRTLTASASSALRLLDGLDPAAVGVIHDLGNLLAEGQEDHRWAFQLLGPYLAHVHVKNGVWRSTGTRDDGTVDWEFGWATLRAGQADVAAYLTALAEHGYDGWVTVEDFSTELPLAERTADNLAYLRSLVA